jgi:hypothetical protein
MCFSKELSFFNFGLLAGYAAYLQIYSKEKDIWLLYYALYYLGFKDFLQGCLYLLDKVEIYKYYLSILSYIHICFQPLFVNIFFSYFSPLSNFFNINNYWSSVFLFNLLFGLYQLTNLDVFDIFREAPYCKDKASDLYSNTNSSYIGKYHVAYKFRTKYKYSPFFYFFMLIPALLTNSYILAIINIIFISIISYICCNLRSGEIAAIWCLLSILLFLPVTYYRKEILEFIETIKIY